MLYLNIDRVFEIDCENIFKIFYSFITQKRKTFYLTCILEIYNTKEWFSGGRAFLYRCYGRKDRQEKLQSDSGGESRQIAGVEEGQEI
jgi:hypothetical protein